MRPIPLHIALTFDDNYWAPAFAVMRSICLASRRPADLNFYLIYIGLDPAHRAELDAIAEEFPATLHHINLAAEPAYRDFVADLPIAPPFTPVIYARLLLDGLLPKEIERVLYLDSDTFVRAPVEDLLDIDLEGKAIGAVLDTGRHKLMLGRDLRSNSDLFDFHFPYFNSGMLVIDRRAYAAADVPKATITLHQQGILARIQYDQAALNLIFKGNWLPLDFRWNLICPAPEHEMLEPKILHYTGYRKPWSLLPTVAFAKAYRHTMTNRLFYRFWRERWRRRLTKPLRKLLPPRP